MARIGTFGKVIQEQEAREAEVPEYDDFLWFDEPIRIKHWINPLAMEKFAVVYDAENMRVTMQTVAAIRSVLEAAILEEDLPKFDQLSLQHDADINLKEELVEYLFIRWAFRPTQRQSISSLGLPTETTEEESSEPSSVVTVDLPQQDSSEETPSESREEPVPTSA